MRQKDELSQTNPRRQYMRRQTQALYLGYGTRVSRLRSLGLSYYPFRVDATCAFFYADEIASRKQSSAVHDIRYHGQHGTHDSSVPSNYVSIRHRSWRVESWVVPAKWTFFSNQFDSVPFANPAQRFL